MMKKIFFLLLIVPLLFSFAQASELGKDSDNNGVWDDMQKVIDEKYSQNPQQTEVLYNYVIALQNHIDAPEQDLGKNTQEISNTMSCVHYVFDPQQAYNLLKVLEQHFVNSKERLEAYGIAMKNAPNVTNIRSVTSENFEKICRRKP